jgi:hypothetical protein
MQHLRFLRHVEHWKKRKSFQLRSSPPAITQSRSGSLPVEIRTGLCAAAESTPTCLACTMLFIAPQAQSGD